MSESLKYILPTLWRRPKLRAICGVFPPQRTGERQHSRMKFSVARVDVHACVAQIVALADLHSVVAQNVVGGNNVKIEVR